MKRLFFITLLLSCTLTASLHVSAAIDAEEVVEHLHEIIVEAEEGPVVVDDEPVVKDEPQYRLVADIAVLRPAALKDATIATSDTLQITRSVLLNLLGKGNEELVDSFKIIVVPKDIDALMAINFGVASAAVCTEEAILKLRQINPKQVERLKELAR